MKSIGRKIRNFFARQYDALLHLDFQDKTNRTILRVVLINFAILFVVCLFWWYGTVALIVYSVMLFMFLKKYTQDLSEKYALLLKSTNQLAEGHLDIPIEGDVGLFNPIQEELKRIQKGFKKAVDEFHEDSQCLHRAYLLSRDPGSLVGGQHEKRADEDRTRHERLP